MSATATRSRQRESQDNAQDGGTPRVTREQVAESIKELLSEEPQSEAYFARQVGLNLHGGRSTAVHQALAVLESRREAKKVPYRGRAGWTVMDSPYEAILPTPQQLVFPAPKMIRVDQMFVPPFQRPLTALYEDIRNDFSIYLFGNLILSDRGPKAPKRERYALVDGQTRWKAASDIGVVEAPALIHTGLSPEQEARLFLDIQRKRKGVTSWFEFRAELYAEEMEVEHGFHPGGDALEIRNLVSTTGFQVGDNVGQIKAVAALRNCYRQDAYLLERTLVAYKAAWPDTIPDGGMIRGLHYLFRNFPVNNTKTKDVIDDARLVRRLQTAGPRKVKAKADAAKEMGTSQNIKAYAIGIEAIYFGK